MKEVSSRENLTHGFAEHEFRMLLDLCADYYWQEDADFRCLFLHSSRSENPTEMLLGNLEGTTLWEFGLLVIGKGEGWAEHLYLRKQHAPFHDLICQIPATDVDQEQPRYLSISGQPRFDCLNRFIGYHCVARDITSQVDNEHSLRRFRAAMDMSGDMIYLVDRTTLKFIDVNETAWRNAGVSRQQLLAADLTVALGESIEEIEKRYDRLILEGISSRVETRSVNREGSPVILETYSRASCIDGQWIIIGVTRNITRRKNSETAALKLQQMFSALSETNTAILRADSPHTLYHKVCEAAIKGGKFNMATVLIPDNKGRMKAVASAGTVATVLKDIRISVDENSSEGRGLAGTTFRTGRACISNDFLLDERTRAWHDLAIVQGVAAAAAFPLLTNKICSAVLLFYSSEKNPFDEDMIELLQSMADNVSFALDNFHHEQQRREAEKILRESEARFRSLTHLSSDFYWEMDAQLRFLKYEGKIVGDSNTEAVSQLIGNHIWNMDVVTPTSMSWEQFRHILEKHERFRDFEISFVNNDQITYHFAMNGEPILDEQGCFHGYRGISRDVTERKRISDHIKYLATHDSLTGLPNRVMFTELLEQATKIAARYNDRGFSVLFIDLDRFKLINDTYGHHMGDELLKSVARRLRQPLRASDVVARMGGDEFVILLQEVTDRRKISKVASNVLQTFAEPIILSGKECRVTVSIGISVYGVDALDEETMMKHADAAMYVAKDEGKDNFQFYSRSIHLRTQEKIDLEVNLRNALKMNELSLHYQPKLNLRSGLVAGVEALLRWKNPQLGNISPERFIPIAEENGMIIPIGEWVLRTACMQSVQWQKEGLFPFCISVNLSARQFNDPELMSKIRAALHVSGMSAHQLEMEITESMVINHPKRAMKVLEEMKSIGLKIALDDFGTGYSSLGQLKHYPIDTLKIDRSFIRDIPQDEDDKAITTAIISMAKTLGLTVVAEGVETQEQLQFLTQQNCHHIQGFHFQKPLPSAEFLIWCRNHDPKQFLGCTKVRVE
ncbi:MAG: EAL domain-containing protein [Gammaproteobacteria bacterium]|nr:EAL domain-containing protein [Gammaproteobacteria bacterium]MDP2349108.1 EAL domain-containing protein [Gammaproteobacteria bacterium]